ncbi:MAG: hypothetical protein SAL07_15350 [Oscillatoria sp. PMC 1051.18]|nr:hypothetical protein [Oscillatoria sp. PMC 1050.18]MEC5031273.1 hypothetical protein [Oscillatoria sp. PMC 1051.18]
MTDFVLIDLTSQADEVWKHIFNLSKLEILAWLSKRGTVEEIQHSFEVNSYLFRSIVDIETVFCLTPNRELLIYLGEANFYQPKRE